MSLTVLLNLIKQLVDFIKERIELSKKEKLKDAVDETINSKDTRKIEEALGGSAGPVSSDKYPGVYTRDKKSDEK